MTGPIARDLEAGFYENFIEGETPIAPHLDDPPAAKDEEGASLIVRSSPSGGSNDLKRLYLLMIAAARSTLDITTPYFVTDESTTWALQDAVQRGVKVRIIVEGDRTDAMPVKYASRQSYEQFLALGIEIDEYQPTMMHTKAIVVDGVVSMFGSANFDNRSLELNDELNVAVASPDLAARLSAGFRRGLRHTNGSSSRSGATVRCWRRRASISGAISGRYSEAPDSNSRPQKRFIDRMLPKLWPRQTRRRESLIRRDTRRAPASRLRPPP